MLTIMELIALSFVYSLIFIFSIVIIKITGKSSVKSEKDIINRYLFKENNGKEIFSRCYSFGIYS